MEFGDIKVNNEKKNLKIKDNHKNLNNKPNKKDCSVNKENDKNVNKSSNKYAIVKDKPFASENKTNRSKEYKKFSNKEKVKFIEKNDTKFNYKKEKAKHEKMERKRRQLTRIGKRKFINKIKNLDVNSIDRSNKHWKKEKALFEKNIDKNNESKVNLNASNEKINNAILQEINLDTQKSGDFIGDKKIKEISEYKGNEINQTIKKEENNFESKKIENKVSNENSRKIYRDKNKTIENLESKEKFINKHNKNIHHKKITIEKKIRCENDKIDNQEKSSNKNTSLIEKKKLDSVLKVDNCEKSTSEKRVTFGSEDEVFKYDKLNKKKKNRDYKKIKNSLSKNDQRQNYNKEQKSVTEHVIIVSNISHKECEETITNEFQKYGQIKTVEMIKNKKTKLPEKAKITYLGKLKSIELYTNEIIMNNKILKINRERTISKSLYETEKSHDRVMINHMNKNLKIIDIRAILRENNIPRVKDIRIKNEGERRRNPGYCFIQFKSPQIAAIFVENFSKMLVKFGNEAKVEYAKEKIGMKKKLNRRIK